VNSWLAPFGLASSLAAASDFALNFYFLQRMSKRHGFSLTEIMKELGYPLRKIMLLISGALFFGIGGIFFAAALGSWYQSVMGRPLGFMSALIVGVFTIVLGGSALFTLSPKARQAFSGVVSRVASRN
jgi:hypothetical protein